MLAQGTAQKWKPLQSQRCSLFQRVGCTAGSCRVDPSVGSRHRGDRSTLNDRPFPKRRIIQHRAILGHRRRSTLNAGGGFAAGRHNANLPYARVPLP